jgi:hypothetical protein
VQTDAIAPVNPPDERAPDSHGGLLHEITDWLGRGLLVFCAVAMVASVLGAIVIVLKWLFINFGDGGFRPRSCVMAYNSLLRVP